MKINKDSLSMRAKNIANKKDVNVNVVYSRYFFDCFLKRLSISCYADKFVLKGGLFLSSVLGIDKRFTIDIDFILRKIRMEHDNIIAIMKEICQIDADDNVTFQYIGDSEIKKDDVYGGFSIHIEGRLDNVRQRFDIDLATADIVYPSDCDYEYQCLVTGEKMHTFLLKGVINSRAKDLYDLYILEKIVEKNNDNLKKAFMITCQNRKYETDKEAAMKILNSVSSNISQRNRWNLYTRKISYAKDISFDDVIASINHLIELLF